MTDNNKDYSLFDSDAISRFLFHPRPEMGARDDGSYNVLSIPVSENVTIGGRFYLCNEASPNLLFFHGNGEIVDDYHDLAQLYNRMNVNFIPVDYRGYGISTGTPTVSSMMNDCHKIFDFVRDLLSKNGCSGKLVVMGRSLGSASALELASSNPEDIDGLIIESGFAFALPLLQLLGISISGMDLKEEDGFDNANKVSLFNLPTLIIHAEFDHIIPFSDGQYLYENAKDPEKKLLMIPGANHNDILARDLESYIAAIRTLIERAVVET